MKFRIELRTLIAGPGDVVEVAPGVMHSFANAGEEEAHAPLLSVGMQRLLLAPLVFASRHPRTGAVAALVGAAGLAGIS